MTPNEREMIFELAKAISKLAAAIREATPADSAAATPEFEAELVQAHDHLQTFIDLVDKEWLPK